MEKAYKNTGSFMLILISLAILGFYKTYFIHFPYLNEGSTALSNISITNFHHIHVAFASLWILFLISQPLLIRKGKFKIHKTIGKISYFIFPLLILSFIPLILNIFHAGYPVKAFLPISGGTLLILFYSLAVYNRKNTPKHMRYMIGTATVFLGPTIGRIGPEIFGLQPNTTQNIQYAIIYSILFSLIFLDRKYDKNFRPYIVILLGWIIHQIVYYILF
jgi:hypothetical protein